ncbi:IS6 family transposase [Burkholderia seminalis]|uniref:IS6 family transposase n=1 Tax=Burkholderia seminalis TaxID=488731 RepID=UPI00158C0C48|nr:IS6 family transposase [Burkholderia seminalis]
MKKSKSLYHGHRFPAGVISCAVRWYFRFQLSLRDIEELLFERGVTVTYETIRCGCDKFGKGFAHRVKAARRKPGSTWHLANVKHVFVKAAARLNNRAENSHQPTRERERRMRGFRDPKRTQEFLSCFGPIRQHFAIRRHLLRASLYRKQLAARFVAWCELTEGTQNPSCPF